VSSDDLLTFTKKQPFEPFRVCLTDGTAYEVRHPDMVIVARRTIAIGIPADQGQAVADRIITASILHVVRVEPIDAAASA
jgi:hypothetical protein